MLSKVFVSEIRERDGIDSLFLVREKITAMAKNGKPYLTLKLMDRSGEVEGRVWDRVDTLSTLFNKDDFIRVKGKASVYLGKMQLVVQDLKKVDVGEIDLADFLPVSPRPLESMKEELLERISSLQDPHLSRLMQAFFTDLPFLQKFATAPAAKGMHHVYLGGLLEHSLAVAALVDDICARYPNLQRDLLICGALLHDVGKVDELSYLRSFDYTDEGKLLGHIMIGVEMIEERLRQIPDFPRELAVHLKHLLLSHHGQYEYGSPKRPKTMEAVILNYLDDLDSKINGVRNHMEKEADSGNAWTSYHRLYDRYFFKGGEMKKTPEASAPAASVPVTSAASVAPVKKSEGKAKKGFSNTLGEQLQQKSLDLFAAADDDKE